MKKLYGNQEVVKFFRYMRLFGICLFGVLSQTEIEIRAIVAWKEDCSNGIPEHDDTQEVVWTSRSVENLDDALVLGEMFLENGQIINDKIVTTSGRNIFSQDWSEKRYQDALKTLLSIRVDIVDDGELSDAFLLHT